MDSLSDRITNIIEHWYLSDSALFQVVCLHELVENHKSTNIARKLICIDARVSPLMIADAIGVDATATKIVMIPSVPSIRACALRHDRPYEFDDVVSIFEEAFR